MRDQLQPGPQAAPDCRCLPLSLFSVSLDLTFLPSWPYFLSVSLCQILSLSLSFSSSLLLSSSYCDLHRPPALKAALICALSTQNLGLGPLPRAWPLVETGSLQATSWASFRPLPPPWWVPSGLWAQPRCLPLLPGLPSGPSRVWFFWPG